MADNRGYLEDRPLRIAATIYPYDRDVNVDQLLTELADHGFVERFEFDGIKIIWIPKFHKHQRPHANEKSYGLALSPNDSEKSPNHSGKSPDHSDMYDERLDHVPCPPLSGSGRQGEPMPRLLKKPLDLGAFADE